MFQAQLTPTTITPAPMPRSLKQRITIGSLKLVLYVAFVMLAIYYTPKVLSATLHTPYPLATITSGSMWPALKQNDLILMRGLAGSDAQVGQIIVFRNDKGFTIHRLVKKTNGKLVTRGDANSADDTPIKEADVVGTVVLLRGKPMRIPLVGIVAQTIGSKLQGLSN